MMNEPAFPHLLSICQRQGETEMYPGLTKRELFVLAAMQGFCSNPDITQSPTSVARLAVQQADALIAELAKEPPK